MNKKVFIIPLIIASVLAVFAYLFVSPALVDKSSIALSPLPEYFYIQPVKFKSFDEKRNVDSRYSVTKLSVDALELYYFAILKRDGWMALEENSKDESFTIIGTRVTEGSLSKENVMITISSISIPEDPSIKSRVTVSYWKE